MIDAIVTITVFVLILIPHIVQFKMNKVQQKMNDNTTDALESIYRCVHDFDNRLAAIEVRLLGKIVEDA